MKNIKKYKKNIEEYNPNEKRRILIVFDDMIADMHSNKKINPILFLLHNLILVCQKY